MFPIKGRIRLVGSALGIGFEKDSIICVDNFYNISKYTKDTYVVDNSIFSKDNWQFIIVI